MALSSLETFLSPRQYRFKKNVNSLIERAVELGLRKADAANARELVENNEWGAAFELVLAQINEYSVAVDEKFIEEAKSIAKSIA